MKLRAATFNIRNSVGVQFSGSSHVIPCAAAQRDRTIDSPAP